ncbi:hypothetical protein QW71_20605 [Paenibacillus sp. IHB B 3415]|nr:hypothetical protein QW71_20605 [Paenibacillus sp. IHB B 3415]
MGNPAEIDYTQADKRSCVRNEQKRGHLQRIRALESAWITVGLELQLSVGLRVGLSFNQT